MARRKTLTDSQIASLPARATPYAHPDPEVNGLYVKVQPTGTKKFLVITRNPNGDQKWITVGTVGIDKIEAMREKARETIKATRDGKSLSGPETFETVANEWFKRHVEAKGIISGKNFRSAIDRHLMPSWGGRIFESIKRGDVSTVLDSVEDSAGPCAADFALSVISMICNWYATRHDDYSSPIIKGMRRSNSKERARDRTLNDDELRQVWRVAEANGPFGAFVRVALLTGQRREKILAMRWDDVVDGEWIIRSEKREKGTAGSLVLPKAALEIINAQPKLASNPHIFAGRADKYLGGESKRKADFDAKLKGVEHFTLHDLRRTARSLMSRAGVRPDIAERVLGHAQGGVLGVYDRHQYRDEKAHALGALAGLIETIINPSDKVVPIRRKGKQA